MKNKKSLIILIPVAIVVWGLIIWQIIPTPQPPNRTNPGTELKQDDSLIYQTYTLVADYPDPFLRENKITQQVKKPVESRIKSVSLKNISELQKYPELTYFGYILCNNSRTALVDLQGKKYLVKEKLEIGNVYILSIGTDSIKIRYHDKNVMYPKKK